MNNLIDFTKVIKEKQEKERARVAYNDLKRVEYRDYSKLTHQQLINHIHALQIRHDFDLGFLMLIDIFMQKNYPEYSWRFDIFLDEVDK